MAIKNLVNGAWQDVSSLKVPVNGAYQTANHANALVNGAWQKVWGSAYYFLNNGVLQNGASTYWMNGTAQDGDSILYTTSNYNSDSQMVGFKLSADMVGKRIYVRANSNVKTRDETSYGYLCLWYPFNSYSSSMIWCNSRVDGLLCFDITSSHVAYTDSNAYLGIGNTYGNTEYRFYDIYIA